MNTAEAVSPPAPPVLKKQPWQLRDQICERDDLSRFAQLLYCRLTDWAFKPQYGRRDGELEISKNFIAEKLHVTPDTVRRAARELERGSGPIWTRVKWSGAHEMTWWYIREWADPQLELFRHTGPNFGRRQGGVQRNTQRGPKGKFAPDPESRRQKAIQAQKAKAIEEFLAGKTTVKAEISADTVAESSLSGLPNQRCQGGEISDVSAENSAVSALENQRCQGGEISAVSAEESALSAQANQPCQGGEMSGLSTLKDDYSEGESFNRLSNRAQGAASEPAAPAKKEGRKTPAPGRAEFMAACREVLGMDEMSKNGGMWSFFFKQDPQCAWAAINDTREAAKTKGAITGTPAAHAVYRYKEFRAGQTSSAKPKPTEKLVPKPKPTRQPEEKLSPEAKARALAALKEATK